MVFAKRTRAAAALSALACAATQPCALGFCTVPSMPSKSLAIVGTSCASASSTQLQAETSGMTRAQALTAIGGAVLVAARPCSAAIPTADDYAFGTGSKVTRLLKEHIVHVLCELRILWCAVLE